MLATLVEPDVIPPLHVERVEVGKAVVVQVHGRGVAGPTLVHQPDLATHVLEAVAAQVVVEDARFGALRVEMAAEGVLQRDIVAAPPPGVAGVHAHIGDEQIEQAVSVIVEKHGARGVAAVCHARLRGDVAKRPMP